MKKPIELVAPEDDERVHAILTGLTAGKTREELANDYDYATYKSLDIYMRRKGYRFDAHFQNYIPQLAQVSQQPDTSKPSRIIQWLATNPEQPALSCQKFSFKDMTELAQYMGSKGYKWNSELNNYELEPQIVGSSKEDAHESFAEGEQQSQESSVTAARLQPTHSDSELAAYLPLLKMLSQNQDKLTEILQPYGNGSKIPRYTIEGMRAPKTMQIAHSLATMVKDFAEEKNVIQRDIFEVALIDFFRKYGYEKELAQLLNIH